MVRRYAMVGLFAFFLVALVAGLTGLKHAAPATASSSVSPNLTCNSTHACLEWDNANYAGLKGFSSKTYGVVGISKTTTAYAYAGVQGLAGSDYANGVEGDAKYGTGVIGRSTYASGVQGFGGPNINSIGVVGSGTTGVSARGTSGDGIAAYSDSGFGESVGSASGIGLSAASTSNIGMQAFSDSGIGLQTSSHSSYSFEAITATGDVQVPVLIYSGVANNSGANVIEAFDNAGAQLMKLTDTGDVHILGTLYTAGSCNSGCVITGNAVHRVVTYAPEESLPTMEDTGEGQLVNGQAYVKIDRALANVIDRGARYLVFITPQGDTRGSLFVSGKTADGFWVHENQGGRSSVAFDYRVVAKPVGAAQSRLPFVTIPIRKPDDIPARHKGLPEVDQRGMHH